MQDVLERAAEPVDEFAVIRHARAMHEDGKQRRAVGRHDVLGAIADKQMRMPVEVWIRIRGNNRWGCFVNFG